MKAGDIQHIEGISLALIAGEKGLDRIIRNGFLYSPDLLIAGGDVGEGKYSIQIVSSDLLKYIRKNPDSSKNILKLKPPCVIVSSDISSRDALVEICEENRIPLFVAHLTLLDTKRRIENILEREFAPSVLIHGTLIDVFGMGILLTGASGIGKTECALDLIFRGHRLVADDMVKITKGTNGSLEGEGIEKSEKLKYHIEIRGIGIVDIRRIFGIKGVRRKKSVELLINLYEWGCEMTPQLTGIESKITKIMDVGLPEVRIPLVPGKNISALIEIIALKKMLELCGINVAKEFDEELIRVMKSEGRVTSDE